MLNSTDTFIEQKRKMSRDTQDLKNIVCASGKGTDQPAHTHGLIRAFASPLNIL